MTEAMAKCSLRSAQKNRMHDGALYDAYVAADDHKLVIAIKEEGAAYGRLVEADRKGHGRGPPQLYKGKAVMRHLAEEVEDAEVAEGELVKYRDVAGKILVKLNAIEAHPIPMQTMFVTQGAVEGMYKEGVVRIVVGYTELETRVLVATAMGLLKEKIEKFAGAAPADGLERIIQSALTEK